MQYDEMVKALQRRVSDGTANPGTVLTATVQAISESAWGEAADLRAQLPGELTDVAPAGPGDRRTLDEFIARIGELSGASDEAEARKYAQAGFDTIGEAISAGQLRQLMESLPDEYGPLAPSVSGLAGNAEAFYAEVRRQGDLDSVDSGREVTQAVLTVVAEAVSGGQAAGLAKTLPDDVGAFLNAAEPAQHTDSDRFFDEIVNRSPVTISDNVRLHTSAVFTALAQWGPGELADTLDHLPRPISELAS